MLKFTKVILAAALTAAAGGALAADIDFNSLKHRVSDESAPAVYFTADISPEGLNKAYEALGRTLTGPVAVKLSTGEAGNNHYLQPSLIKDLVQKVDGTIVECNTAYGGSRASTAMHRQVIKDHGFDQIAKVDIMDEEGDMEIPVTGGKYLKADLVGSHLANYKSMMVLTHFKGHAMGGFGGALKNISIGVASASGKARIHTANYTDSVDELWTADGGSYVSNDTDEHLMFIYSMAEAADAVSDYFDHGREMLYISVMNNLSVDCDCDGSPDAPDMHDIGILASLDPVALDQACVDLVYAAPDGASLIERMESRRGPAILPHAQEMGLGSTSYRLVSLDAQ
ncbi:MAG: DUF362 domain-containing protein [Proteobacteria bacterium]|uniref:DUF362 domain-containing protein n=1 Tax=Candidatus Avisuccinivibrio stercorigallinarum TaxID=2840704 RepID=A0A9D9GSW0_9GAMM|nr:DUF362 domain-containing protein [Candidatus Avisuccinivibrio stercorigallinarum]